MYRFHVSYYDPFPYEKNFATSLWDDVLDILERYTMVRVHLHNKIRNRSTCPFCTED